MMVAALRHDRTSLIRVFNLIYLQCFFQLKSQWTDIWYEDGSFANSTDQWTMSHDLKYNYNSPDNCVTGTCIRMECCEWMSRRSNIANYCQLRLKYDLTIYDRLAQSYGPGSCRIYYAYDSRADKALTQSFELSNTPYLDNQTHILEVPIDKRILWLWFHTEQSEFALNACFWDNIYLQGILGTQITYAPTLAPNNYTVTNWRDIWFEDGTLNDSGVWRVYDNINNSHLKYDYSSAEGCFTGNCIMQISPHKGDTWLMRRTDIVVYSYLRLRFDMSMNWVNPYSTETDGACQLFYAYDSELGKKELKTFEYPARTSGIVLYDDQCVSLPPASWKSSMYIWFQPYNALADHVLDIYQYCYWDNIYLQGVLEPNVAEPTRQPTGIPSPGPTRAPTMLTASPTHNPSQSPTESTSHPTSVPSESPLYPTSTHIPTSQPVDASHNPTTDDTTEPALSPVTKATIVTEQANLKQYALLLGIAITIPFIIFCGYQIKQHMGVVIINKALVLIVGVSRFNDNKLHALPGIESNVTDLTRLWFDAYHYTVKICNETTLRCTKRDIIRFIDQYKHLLEDTNYKAVIVHILSHGSGDDSFMTSDLKTMQTSFFEHELITTAEFAGHPELIKLIFHHACRGRADYFVDQIDKRSNKFSSKFSVELKEIISHKEYEDNKAVPLRTDYNSLLKSKQTKAADAHSNCVVLYGTIENRALSDNGHFTESICKVFGTNSRNPIKRDLYCLIRQIGSDLETRTNNAQICTSKGIGTLRNK
eukprot:1003507_1